MLGQRINALLERRVLEDEIKVARRDTAGENRIVTSLVVWAHYTFRIDPVVRNARPPKVDAVLGETLNCF
jgi:hypothetical protein